VAPIALKERKRADGPSGEGMGKMSKLNKREGLRRGSFSKKKKPNSCLNRFTKGHLEKRGQLGRKEGRSDGLDMKRKKV